MIWSSPANGRGREAIPGFANRANAVSAFESLKEKLEIDKALFLRKRFEIRWKNIVKRSETVKLTLPDKEALWKKVLESYRNGFRCAYCGRKLEIIDRIPPYLRSFSLDHKISISCGGDNSIDNFKVVCHECNIIKGTMPPSTFLELLQAMNNHDPTLRNRVFRGMWNGRIANKLEREKGVTQT